MSIELRAGDVSAFFDAPFRAYDASVGYVSPMKGDIARMLDAAKNPLWTAGKLLRRVAVVSREKAGR